MIETVRLLFLNSRRSSSGCFGLKLQNTKPTIMSSPRVPGMMTLGREEGALAGDRRDAVEEQRQAGRHQGRADPVEGLRRGGAVGREGAPGVDDRGGTDRHVDQEDPVPRVVVDEVATEDGAEDRAEQHRHAEDGHQATHPGRAGRAGHDRHAERHEHAAAETLQEAEADEHVDRGGRGAQHRAEREEQQRRHVEALGAEPVGRPAGERDDHGQRQRVGDDRPGDGGVQEGLTRRPELGLEGREGDVDDGDVEDRHDGAEDDDTGDLEDGPVDLVGVHGGRGLRWC